MFENKDQLGQLLSTQVSEKGNVLKSVTDVCSLSLVNVFCLTYRAYIVVFFYKIHY